ncbi:MAG: flagellar assembly protein FliW, partial [Tumebacillaceae bacterium]
MEQQPVYHFPDGLYGLEELKRFVIVQPDEKLPFAYLQAVDDPAISLLITNPFLTHSYYEFDLSEQDLAMLEQPTPEQ